MSDWKIGDVVVAHTAGGQISGRVIALPPAKGSPLYLVLASDGRAYTVPGQDLAIYAADDSPAACTHDDSNLHQLALFTEVAMS